LTPNAPAPAKDKGIGSGGNGARNFSQAVQRVARPGIKRMPASAIPTRARFVALQASAIAIKKLTDASSRKSMLSATSETEPIARATANSTPKLREVEDGNDKNNFAQIH
jgi:hypothetical protein